MLITRRPDSRIVWCDQGVVLEVSGHSYGVAPVNLSPTGALVAAPSLAALDVSVGAMVKLTDADDHGSGEFSAFGRAVRLNPVDDDNTEIGIEFNMVDLSVDTSG